MLRAEWCICAEGQGRGRRGWEGDDRVVHNSKQCDAPVSQLRALLSLLSCTDRRRTHLLQYLGITQVQRPHPGDIGAQAGALRAGHGQQVGEQCAAALEHVALQRRQRGAQVAQGGRGTRTAAATAACERQGAQPWMWRFLWSLGLQLLVIAPLPANREMGPAGVWLCPSRLTIGSWARQALGHSS